jgi:HSP20 family molecular chaperone IbpA
VTAGRALAHPAAYKGSLDELTVLRNRLDRLFGRFFEEDEPMAMTNRWMPAVDVIETRDALIFKTELPGFEEKEAKPRKIALEINKKKLATA